MFRKHFLTFPDTLRQSFIWLHSECGRSSGDTHRPTRKQTMLPSAERRALRRRTPLSGTFYGCDGHFCGLSCPCALRRGEKGTRCQHVLSSGPGIWPPWPKYGHLDDVTAVLNVRFSSIHSASPSASAHDATDEVGRPLKHKQASTRTR